MQIQLHDMELPRGDCTLQSICSLKRCAQGTRNFPCVV
uniref:Uncharacterized protein n=1 Tax=Arundo donax TaxID=35708 RepID=A0A0A8YZU7_ARUDO